MNETATTLPWLSLLILLPFLGGLVVVGLPADGPSWARRLGLLFGLAALMGVGALGWSFQGGPTGYAWIERHAWMPTLNVQFSLGVDGLSLVLLLLTALVIPFMLWTSPIELTRQPLFVALVLWLQAGLFGAFTALQFVPWFLFWELTLIPAYFLVRLWGGPGRTAAAGAFFVYTMLGSLTLLLGFVAIYSACGTFEFEEIAARVRKSDGGIASLLGVRLSGGGWDSRTLALAVFWSVFLGFAVKLPVWPFHGWMPRTYSEAPASVTLLLTGTMSKLGIYGMIRMLLPIFPEQIRQSMGVLQCLAVATIVFSALAAFHQTQLRRMLAYLSMNHLGYCWLGVLAAAQATGTQTRWITEKEAALAGVILQVFNHGIIASSLFACAAWLEVRLKGPVDLREVGGLRSVAPVFCGAMGIILFAALGLPGLSGFVGEFLIFKGAWPLLPTATTFSVLGLLFTAAFLLTLSRRLWHGPPPVHLRSFPDLTLTERWQIAPALLIIIGLGVFPQLILAWINPVVLRVVERLGY